MEDTKQSIESTKLSMDPDRTDRFDALFFLSEERTSELAKITTTAVATMLLEKGGMHDAILYIYNHVQHMNEYSFCLMMLTMQYEQQRTLWRAR